MWKESFVESSPDRMCQKYTGFPKKRFQTVFAISQLPEHLEIKVKTISGIPVHADYVNVLDFFIGQHLTEIWAKEYQG